MKIEIKHLLFSFLFVSFCFTSCQDEIINIDNLDEQEALVPNSTLVNLMSRISANSGTADNILEGASCFSVALPVTVIVSNTTIIIETEADLEQLENSLNNENSLGFVFPITIIYADYSETVIENENELQSFIDSCVDNSNNYIECIDFVYPISFSVFNAEFNLIDTVIVENDEALYLFLNTLETTENTLIVSLNFPITLKYANDETVVVNANQDLADVIEAVDDNCNDEVFTCFSDFELLECADSSGEAVFNLSTDTIGLIICTESFIASFHTTLADAENNTNAISNTEFYSSMQGEVYLRIEAESGNFEIFTVVLNTENCNDFECFESFDAVLEVCYTDATALYEFNLPVAFSNCTPSADLVTYHETQADAETAVNPFANPSTYSTNELNSTVYVRVEINTVFQIFPIQLNVISCNAGDCTVGDIAGILTSCHWNISSYNGSDNLISYNFYFEQNTGIVVIQNDSITIDASWSIIQSNNGVIIAFSNVSGPNIQAITGSWLVVECTETQLVLHSVTDSNNEIVLDRICD